MGLYFKSKIKLNLTVLFLFKALGKYIMTQSFSVTPVHNIKT